MADPVLVQLTSPDGTRTRGFTTTTAVTMRHQGWTDPKDGTEVFVPADGPSKTLASLPDPPPPTVPTTPPGPGTQGTTATNNDLESDNG